jgi:glycine oxidase
MQLPEVGEIGSLRGDRMVTRMHAEWSLDVRDAQDVPMDDVLILGAGVIGLSLAYELAGHGARVRVIDRGTPGQEASWAGAGILPPAGGRPGSHPYEQLAALSENLHPRWAEQLRAETGIDNGFRRTGGLYVARTADEAEALRLAAGDWRRRHITVQDVPAAALTDVEPALADPRASPQVRAAWLLPDECQLRNPHHLRALLAACAARGVTVTSHVAAGGFEVRGARIDGVHATAGLLRAGCVCVTGGAWTRELLLPLGIDVAIRPIRGQIVLLAAARPPLRRIVNDGPRYLVPRPDGRVLIGSTEEDAGFEKRNTPDGVAGLLRFALALAPSLAEAALERCWSGLRPATVDGMPYIGPLPGIDNGFVAAGHFRSGLTLSPGTAVVLSQLIRGERPAIDLTPLRIDRR